MKAPLLTDTEAKEDFCLTNIHHVRAETQTCRHVLRQQLCPSPLSVL